MSIEKSIPQTMEDILYRPVSFGLSILAVVIGCFIFLTNPSTDNNIALQLQDARITGQQLTITGLTKTAQNDTKELKLQVGDLAEQVILLSNKMTELTTIINERIPKPI